MPEIGGRSRGRFSSQRMQNPCGSQSIRVGGGPRSAKKLAKLVASVVLPQPPLGFRTTILCRLSAPVMLITVPPGFPAVEDNRAIAAGTKTQFQELAENTPGLCPPHELHK